MSLKGIIVPASSLAREPGSSNAALQTVANRPIICHVLEDLRDAGVAEVEILTAAHELDAVRAAVTLAGPPELQLELLPYEGSEDIDRALAAAAQAVGAEPCLVHVADGLIDQPLSLEAVGAAEHDLVVFAHAPAGAADSVSIAARRLLSLLAARPEEWPLEPTGACAFGSGGLARAIGTSWWPAGVLDLLAVSEGLANGGGSVAVQRVRGWRQNTGSMADLLEINRIALDAIEPTRLDIFGSGARIEGDVEVHPSARIESSTIVGPVVVGADALVLDSYIGPYTSIGAGVRIEGAEVERSIVLPGATIAYIGGRLAGSVVGRDARIFRDFSLPRAMRLYVGDGDEVALC